MDLNNVVLSGRVFDMGYNPMLTIENSGVAEGKLSVSVGVKNGEEMFDEFNIRAYGKKADFISLLRDGTFVVLEGVLREDIRVNSGDPSATRSKTYININRLKAVRGKEEDWNE